MSQKTCNIDDCSEPPFKRGFCRDHYHADDSRNRRVLKTARREGEGHFKKTRRDALKIPRFNHPMGVDE